MNTTVIFWHRRKHKTYCGGIRTFVLTIHPLSFWGGDYLRVILTILGVWETEKGICLKKREAVTIKKSSNENFEIKSREVTLLVV